MRKKSSGAATGLAVAIMSLIGTIEALAQAPTNPRDLFDHPAVWDFRLGVKASTLSEEGFMEFACGTNGGPPARAVRGFGDSVGCTAEANGVKEIHFRYDDEAEYWARANDLRNFISLYEGTTAYSHPIIVSVLIDARGVVAGIRAVSDPRIAVERRQDAYLLRNFLMARFGIEFSDCADLPRDERETQIGRSFIKQRCERLAGDRRIMLETHYYRRPGEAAFVPNTTLTTEGQFISRTRLEMQLTPGALAAAGAEGAAAAAPAPDLAIFGPREQEFLAGRTKSCADCKLEGALLKRRDLAGADLRGADLARANLHDAKLGGADLTGAILLGANLNKADLRRAKLMDAKLDHAMLYESYADNANFSRASMAGAMIGHARLTRTSFAATNLERADLREVRAAEAGFEGAILTEARLDGAQLRGAKLRGAELSRVMLYEARLTDADLADAVLARSDLYGADLTRADLSRADLSDARLLVANMTDAVTVGANFAGAEMPDGRIHP